MGLAFKFGFCVCIFLASPSLIVDQTIRRCFCCALTLLGVLLPTEQILRGRDPDPGGGADGGHGRGVPVQAHVPVRHHLGRLHLGQCQRQPLIKKKLLLIRGSIL